MFGKNPVRKRDHGNGHHLALQGEPFHTIQGEGPFAGYPAIFVRLWGCHLRCSFCDTDFESDERVTSLDTLLDKTQGANLIVLTGGEPMRQNIEPLVRKLLDRGQVVQVETSGNLWVPGLEEHKMRDLYFVISPKTHVVDEHIAQYAISWKYIISARHEGSTYDGLPLTDTQDPSYQRVLARPPQGTEPINIFVQPMDEQEEDQNQRNRDRCVALAKRYGYRVSLQQHKILNVP